MRWLPALERHGRVVLLDPERRIRAGRHRELGLSRGLRLEHVSIAPYPHVPAGPEPVKSGIAVEHCLRDRWGWRGDTCGWWWWRARPQLGGEEDIGDVVGGARCIDAAVR